MLGKQRLNKKLSQDLKINLKEIKHKQTIN